MAPIKVVGDAFVRLLQMTVLPYVSLSLSLMIGLGSLRVEGAAALALRAGASLLALWAAAFVAISSMPLTSLLAFWTAPGRVAAATPYGWSDVMRTCAAR